MLKAAKSNRKKEFSGQIASLAAATVITFSADAINWIKNLWWSTFLGTTRINALINAFAIFILVLEVFASLIARARGEADIRAIYIDAFTE